MRYHSTLGLDRDEITELVRRVFQVLESQPKPSGRPPSLGLYRQVMLVLMYLRQNVSQTMLADLHRISQPTVSRIYRSIMPLLDQVLCVHQPELTSVFTNREVLVDGTLVPTGNRADSKHNYSSKRLRQSLNIQVAAATDGTPLAVLTPVASGRHDRQAITECGWEPILDGYTWYADAASIGTTATVPYKRSKYHDLTGYEQTVNKPISTRRSAVERAIGHLKNWKSSPPATAAHSPNYPTSSASPPASSTTDSNW